MCKKVAAADASKGRSGAGAMTSSMRKLQQTRGLVRGVGSASTSRGTHSPTSHPSSASPAAPLAIGGALRKGPGRASALRVLLCRAYLRASLSAARGKGEAGPYDGNDDDGFGCESSSSSSSDEGRESRAESPEIDGFEAGRLIVDGGGAASDDAYPKEDVAKPPLQPTSSEVPNGGSLDPRGCSLPVSCCWSCGALAGGGEGPQQQGGERGGPALSLKKCTGCRRAMYCSPACQNSHWKVHKADCRGWEAERKNQTAC